MTSPLFRQEAIEYRKERLFGEVLLLQPVSFTIITCVLLLIVLIAGSFLFLGTYARKERVRGFLEPDKGIVKIYAPQQGVLSKIHVKEGEHIQQGQILATLLTERTLPSGQDVDNKVLEELALLKQKKFKSIEIEKNLFQSEKLKLMQQQDDQRHEAQQINKAIELHQQRLELVHSRLEGAQRLAKKGHLSETELQKAQEEWLSLEQQRQELLRSLQTKQSSLHQIRSDLEQLPYKLASRIAELENAITEINQRATEIQGRHQFVIRSPVEGKVTTLSAREGQWQTNMQMMAIMPKSSQLEAELFVPTRAIGFLEMGQNVRIRFDAFPYQRYGIYQGTVIAITQNILIPQELGLPLESNEPVYRVTVALASQHIQAYGKHLPLQAGMSLEADIILEKRSLFDWILDPLYSLKGKV